MVLSVLPDECSQEERGLISQTATYGETFQGGRVGSFCVTQVTKMFYFSLYFSAVLAKGEMEPERKVTRTKVDEDRKHEYPYRPCAF